MIGVSGWSAADSAKYGIKAKVTIVAAAFARGDAMIGLSECRAWIAGFIAGSLVLAGGLAAAKRQRKSMPVTIPAHETGPDMRVLR